MPNKPTRFKPPGTLIIQLSTVWKVLYNLTVEKPGVITRQKLEDELARDSTHPVTQWCLVTFQGEELIKCVKAPEDLSVISNPSKESDFNQFILTSKGVKRGPNYLTDDEE